MWAKIIMLQILAGLYGLPVFKFNFLLKIDYMNKWGVLQVMRSVSSGIVVNM